jgi:hypothetical protein
MSVSPALNPENKMDVKEIKSTADASFTEMLKHVNVGEQLYHGNLSGFVSDKKFIADGNYYQADVLLQGNVVGPSDNIDFEEFLKVVKVGNILLFGDSSYQVTEKRFNQEGSDYSINLSMQQINEPNWYQSGKLSPSDHQP